MAPHKEYQYFVLQLGSVLSHAQFDSVSTLHDSYPSKTISIPSKVYRHSNGKPKYYASHSSTTDGSDEVKFIENGVITDNSAFNYFVKLAYRSLLKFHTEDQDTYTHHLLNVNLVIIPSSSLLSNFSKPDLQTSINYFYENLDHVISVTIVSNSLCLLLAYGSNNLSTSLVIDIGFEKFTVQPIVDYLPLNYALALLEIGGNDINKKLAKLLPEFSESQIEDLKKSDIYEILSDETKKTHQDFNDEEIDVLKIVTSDKPKELLLEREKQEKSSKANGGEPKVNSELESNTFTDSTGKQLTVGKPRFMGFGELIDQIHFYVDYSIKKISDTTKRQELWSNIILNGPVTNISGFKEYLNQRLRDNYLVASESSNDPEAKFRSTGNTESSVSYSQVPNQINFLKKPEYFADWKSEETNVSDLTVLGALILIKLSFGPGSHTSQITNIGNDLYLIKKEDFEESGPDLIWDLNH